MTAKVAVSSSADDNIIFEEPYLILVEGKDDQAVAASMIRHEDLSDFRVHHMYGKTSWASRIEVIVKQPDFKANVRSLGLIRDADNDPDAAWDSCIGTLRACSLPTPPAVAQLAEGPQCTGIMIVPSRSDKGAIEELCMRSFDPSRLSCVDGYFSCLADKTLSHDIGKGRIQALLAGLESAPRDLTVAAHRGTLDMSHSIFDELRTFVRMLAECGTTSTG